MPRTTPTQRTPNPAAPLCTCRVGHITTIGQLFEIIDWDFDGAGLVVTDGEELANAIANRFPYLINDMPQFVKE